MSKVTTRSGQSFDTTRLKDQTEWVMDELKTLGKFIDAEMCREKDIRLYLNSIAERLDKQDRRLEALATKLDSEDVTNLDTDYTSTIKQTQ